MTTDSNASSSRPTPSRVRALIGSLSPYERGPAVSVALMVILVVVLVAGVWIGFFGGTQSPFSVVEAFYEAGSVGDTARARTYLTRQADQHVGGMEQAALRQTLLELTAGDELREVELSFARIRGGDRGDRAHIIVLLVDHERNIIDVRVEDLVKEDGEWRIVCPDGLNCPLPGPSL